MRLKIFVAPSPVLSTVAAEVPLIKSEKGEFSFKENQALQSFLDDMLETMIDAGGIGLAAPQVGKSLRIFLMQTPYMNQPIWFINPVLRPVGSDMMDFDEGCLSLPDLSVKTKRYRNIKVEYLNRECKSIVDDYSNLEAVCCQHENDHIDGKTMLDTLIDEVEKKMMEQKALEMQKKVCSQNSDIFTN